MLRMITAEPTRLRRRAISLGLRVHDADDAAQTVLLRAWQSIDGIRSDDTGTICSWLDTIARNAALDLHRVNARTAQLPDDDELPASQSVEADAAMRLELRRVLEAIAALPPTLAEPLRLQLLEELNANEVAERLGLAPAAVRQRLSRARRALRAALE